MAKSPAVGPAAGTRRGSHTALSEPPTGGCHELLVGSALRRAEPSNIGLLARLEGAPNEEAAWGAAPHTVACLGPTKGVHEKSNVKILSLATTGGTSPCFYTQPPTKKRAEAPPPPGGGFTGGGGYGIEWYALGSQGGASPAPHIPRSGPGVRAAAGIDMGPVGAPKGGGGVGSSVHHPLPIHPPSFGAPVPCAA